ncbi:MAG: hypothetical protein IPP71_06245 [Bacteroidetes bacterium]|nr:hypothetical protein [Bacteroidota bacterium]
MCDYKVLYKDSSGYVVKCESCNSLQLAFGNVSFPIKESDFVILYSVVERELENRVEDTDQLIRKIYLVIPGSKTSLVFNLFELKNFQHLLQEAHLQNEINILLQ